MVPDLCDGDAGFPQHRLIQLLVSVTNNRIETIQF